MGIDHWLGIELLWRVVLALGSGFLISVIIGYPLIRVLRSVRFQQPIYELSPPSHQKKQNTPSMGGLIFLLATLIPTLVFADMAQQPVQILMISLLGFAIVGFIDDYIKFSQQKNSGLSPRKKIFLQVLVSSIVMAWPFFSLINSGQLWTTNVPFMDDSFTVPWQWVVFPWGVFILIAVSNSVNITDGLDGLSTGLSAICLSVLGALAFFAGSDESAHFWNLLFIDGGHEMAVFAAATVGSLLGFLWFNAFPARIFMGDMGSLALGGLIGAFAILIRHELILPIIGIIFLLESASVILQVSWFRITHGRRLFRMAPFHHHLELSGLKEPLLVMRFWLIGLAAAAIGIMGALI